MTDAQERYQEMIEARDLVYSYLEDYAEATEWCFAAGTRITWDRRGPQTGTVLKVSALAWVLDHRLFVRNEETGSEYWISSHGARPV